MKFVIPVGHMLRDQGSVRVYTEDRTVDMNTSGPSREVRKVSGFLTASGQFFEREDQALFAQAQVDLLNSMEEKGISADMMDTFHNLREPLITYLTRLDHMLKQGGHWIPKEEEGTDEGRNVPDVPNE